MRLALFVCLVTGLLAVPAFASVAPGYDLFSTDPNNSFLTLDFGGGYTLVVPVMGLPRYPRTQTLGDGVNNLLTDLPARTPEPATFLAVAAGLGLAVWKRRRRSL